MTSPDDRPPPTDSRTAFRRSLAWTLAERYAGLVINFLGLTVLARLLTPAEFGIFAIAAGLSALLVVLRDFGATNWIIQAPELPDWQLRTAATLTLASGLLLAACLAFGAPLAARLYGEEELTPVIQVASIGFLLNPLTLVPMAMLSRELRFKELFLINTLGALAGTASSIAAALLGYGPMSPAIGIVVSAATTLFGTMLRAWSYHVVRPGLRGWRDILSFSAYSMGAGMLSEVGRVLPTVLVGRTLGVDAAGLLNRSYAVSLLFQKLILQAAKRAALPVLALGRREGVDLSRAYLAKIAFMAAVSWPAALLFLTLAEQVVAVVLGRNWESAVPVVQVLSLTLVFLPLTALNNEFYIAMGRVRLQLWVEMVATGARIAMVLLAALHSLEAVAVAMVASRAVAALVSSLLAQRMLGGVGARALGKVLLGSLPPTIGALAGPGLVWAADLSATHHPVLVLAAAGLAAAVGWLLGLWVSNHPLGGEVARLLPRFPIPRLPRPKPRG